FAVQDDMLYCLSIPVSQSQWDEQMKLWKFLEPLLIHDSEDADKCVHACLSGNRKLIKYVFSKYNPNGFYLDDANKGSESTVLWALTCPGHLPSYWHKSLDSEALDFAEFVFSMPSFDPRTVMSHHYTHLPNESTWEFEMKRNESLYENSRDKIKQFESFINFPHQNKYKTIQRAANVFCLSLLLEDKFFCLFEK